ncbi:MAG: ribonuclease PH [Dehalococcoidia bacterium]
MSRVDGRSAHELRPVTMEPGFQVHAEGSVLISLGLTRVLCSVSVEDKVPAFLRGTGAGWVTAEYAMLPRSTNTRTQRETGRIGGRTHEIQRLIGRSLRAVTDLDILGDRTFTVDCDVLQADGGTRTAAITGGYVALYLAMQRLVDAGSLSAVPLAAAVAATSVGLVGGKVLLDLCYQEDSSAEVDFNIVKTSGGDYVEVQGTAEGKPFSREVMDEMLAAADEGIGALFALQARTIQQAREG